MSISKNDFFIRIVNDFIYGILILSFNFSLERGFDFLLSWRIFLLENVIRILFNL